jgi:hypothetical protein
MFVKQAHYRLSSSSIPFWTGYFGDGVFHIICPGWFQRVLLLISTSQVAMITGMRERAPAGLTSRPLQDKEVMMLLVA